MKYYLRFLLCLFCVPTASADDIRIGVIDHDIGNDLKKRYEKGYNVNLEYMFDNDYSKYILPHIGTSINTLGYTSTAYTGLTAHLENRFFFIELSFGGGIHNGELKHKKKRQALGSRLLFRESLSVGKSFGQQHSISFIVDHMSNAGISQPNSGLTNWGIRYGYKF